MEFLHNPDREDMAEYILLDKMGHSSEPMVVWAVVVTPEPAYLSAESVCLSALPKGPHHCREQFLGVERTNLDGVHQADRLQPGRILAGPIQH